MTEATTRSARDRLRKLFDEAETPASVDFESWCERVRLALGAAYGDPSQQLARFDNAYPTASFRAKGSGTVRRATQERTLGQARKLVGVFIEDLEQSDVHRGTRPTHGTMTPPKVFVVHGHDGQLLSEVARFLEQLGLKAIVLKEQSNRGRAILEKFEQEAGEVAAAVVLLTADDFGHAKDGSSPAAANRARQNVILEFGYFWGLLTREKTIAVYEPGVELPNDVTGLLYIGTDTNWKGQLAVELRDSAGLPIDMNKVAP